MNSVIRLDNQMIYNCMHKNRNNRIYSMRAYIKFINSQYPKIGICRIQYEPWHGYPLT